MNTFNLAPRLLLLATTIVCAVATSAATVCAAADRNDFPSVIVKFTDLNLSSPEGANVLYRRINSAARDVCKSYNVSSGDFERARSADSCVLKTIEMTVRKVGLPALLAIYNAKHPQPGPVTVASNGTR